MCRSKTVWLEQKDLGVAVAGGRGDYRRWLREGAGDRSCGKDMEFYSHM